MSQMSSVVDGLAWLQEFTREWGWSSWIATGVAVAVPLLYFINNWRLRDDYYNFSLWKSVELSPGVRTNAACPTGDLVDALVDEIGGKRVIRTVYDCLQRGVRVSGPRPCVGRIVNGKYEWTTFNEFAEAAGKIGRFLRSCGVERQKCVGIWALNQPEWCVAQFGCVTQAMVTVPLYDTLGLEAIRHTVNEVELSVIFCDNEDKLKSLLKDRENFPLIKTFVLMQPTFADANFVEACSDKGIKAVLWADAIAEGDRLKAKYSDVKPNVDDLFLIQYTSGTTGIAKGVMLTHGNMIADIAGAGGAQEVICLDIARDGLNDTDSVLMYLPLAHGYAQTISVGVQCVSKGVILTHANMIAEMAGTYDIPKMINSRVRLLSPDDSCLMYLPLAHAYGQSNLTWFIYAGGKIGFTSGSILKLMDDLQLLKPTYMSLVPRIMNRLYTKVQEETKSGLKGKLFWFAYHRKRALFRAGYATRKSIWDILLFGKLQRALGGNVRFMTTGSAPVSKEVLEFWRVVFGALIMEGYGQTESTAAATGAVDFEGGNVGHPILCNLVKLADIPEMGYRVSNVPPQGEICIKGPNVMTGYYKRKDLTDECLIDGWLHTGDIGEFSADGSLRMIDRKKHIFKLAQGEYVAPEKIEAVYAQCTLVANVFVDGNSLQAYTVAIIVPDATAAMHWYASQEVTNPKASFAEICSNKAFIMHILNSLIAVGKENKLNSIEQVKSIYVHSEPFSVANGLLTPSLKNKRQDLRKLFATQIADLYAKGPLIGSRE